MDVFVLQVATGDYYEPIKELGIVATEAEATQWCSRGPDARDRSYKRCTLGEIAFTFAEKMEIDRWRPMTEVEALRQPTLLHIGKILKDIYGPRLREL